MRIYAKWMKFYSLVVLVGVVAGIGAIFFRELIGLVHNLLFYGRFSINYDVLQHAAPSRWGMGIILVPMLGAVMVAFLVKNFAPEAKGHGVPEVMDAIYYQRGIVRPIVAVVKALASSISIGSGGSVGREGPIIQIGAAFGSAIGQWVRVANWERITLVACGTSGAIAASFNAPLGGILFAIEIMLPELSARTLIPVSIATTIATYISYMGFGNVPFIPLTTVAVTQLHVMSVISYIVMSVVLGLFSTLFIHCIYYSEDLFDLLHKSYYIRHVVGMFFIGLSMYLMMQSFGHYYIQGVGYATILDVLSLTLTHPGFLFFLALLKLIDTAITLGSGGSGGIFSPLLFIGATLGAGFAGVCDYISPTHIEMGLQLGALAGMAGMVGASTGALITAVVMTAELTNDFTIILPLLLIVAVAYAVRRVLIKDSIYTLKLTRRGHKISQRLHAHPNVMK